MNLDNLRTLICIVERGNLSAAARARGLSQPAVTKQVQRMEAETGLALLVRGPKRQVEMTPAGELLLDFARETLAGYENLERRLAALKTAGSGVLSVAASTIPGEYLLPAILAAHRREYPQVDLKMSISDTAYVVAKVLADEADVGVIGSPVKQPNLRLERLASDEIVLVVPPDHSFAGRTQVDVTELHDQSLILREAGSGTRQSVEAALAASGVALPRRSVALTLGSTQAILQAAEQGLGVGFVSERASAPARTAGRLSCVRLNGVDLHRSLYLAYLPERIGDPLVARFLDFARAQIK